MIRKFFRLLSILVLCAALFFGYQTLEWSNKYKQGHDEYEKLQAQNTPENESTPENDSDSTKELPFCPDWTALKAENPDIVGWIRMDPTCDYLLCRHKIMIITSIKDSGAVIISTEAFSFLP